MSYVVRSVRHPRLRHKDGFRLLIEARAGGEVRGWSRHGTDLTARLGSLLAPFAEVAPGTTFDGELVAVSERDGKPIQDFAAVTRAVFTGRPAATDRLRFVAFDVLAVAGEDVRARAWEDRDACLHETLPVCERIRLAVSQPATLAAHEAIVALGFEGTVLRRCPWRRGSRRRGGFAIQLARTRPPEPTSPHRHGEAAARRCETGQTATNTNRCLSRVYSRRSFFGDPAQRW